MYVYNKFESEDWNWRVDLLSRSVESPLGNEQEM